MILQTAWVPFRLLLEKESRPHADTQLRASEPAKKFELQRERLVFQAPPGHRGEIHWGRLG